MAKVTGYHIRDEVIRERDFHLAHSLSGSFCLLSLMKPAATLCSMNYSMERPMWQASKSGLWAIASEEVNAASSHTNDLGSGSSPGQA